jgi:hypothetical protein
MSVWRHGLPRARQRRRLALVLSTACAMSACQVVDRQPAYETVFFPQPPPHEGPTIRLLAIGSGTLALEDDCLWLKSGADRDLIIWPPSYRLVANGGRLTVLRWNGCKGRRCRRLDRDRWRRAHERRECARYQYLGRGEDRPGDPGGVQARAILGCCRRASRCFIENRSLA